MGCLKLTYYPETEPKINTLSEALTLKISSKTLRSFYLFGFNGKELDNEIQGDGNAYDFGARIYDSRLGRWLSLDPLQAKYPFLSPYNFCANSPIFNKEIDGADFEVSIEKNKDGKRIAVIKATVYTVDKSKKKQAEAGADKWRALDGTMIDFNGEKLEVQFQITVETAEGNTFKDRTDNAVSNAQASDVSNAYVGVHKPDEYEEFIGSKIKDGIPPPDKEVTAGLTIDGQCIYMPNYNMGYGQAPYNLANDENAVGHEIGHLFGLKDNTGNGGIMDYGTYEKGPNQKDVQSIIDYATSPEAGRAKAKVTKKP